MQKVLKRIFVYGVIVVVVVATAFFATREPVVQYASNVITLVKEYSLTHDDVLQELRQEIFTQPLRGTVAADLVSLSPSEIIRLTNKERSKQGLYPLQENRLLNAAARAKLQDMFDRQYFEHISPDGRGPGAVVAKAGYSYVVVGENLALGTFKNDQELVDAWMKSVGHRENMLNKRYLEIGVAVGNGTFNGERVWLAVQEFGKPSTACPTISTLLKNKIEQDKTLVASTSAELGTLRAAVEAMPRGTPEESEVYNGKVSEYNNLVVRYNEALENLKKEIDEYNQVVRNFNECARQ